MATKELVRLTLADIYRERVVSKTQPGEWEIPEQFIGEFEVTLPTPLQAENDLLGTTSGAVTMLKDWDRSPVDPSSFDPTEPPGRPVPPVQPPANTTLPMITVLTTLEVGQQLACGNGTWSGSPTYTRQWTRNGNAIGGATAASYTLVTLDIGANIGCRVTGTNAGGATTADAVPVGPVTVARPVNSVAPVVSTPNGIAVGAVISSTNGTWSGAPTYAILWQRGGATIPGATNNNYTLVGADVGLMIGSVVQATNGGGSNIANSNTVGPITTTTSDEPGDGPAVQPTQPTRPQRPRK
jgi:hypothetical protein